MKDKCGVMADNLYAGYLLEEKRGCGDLYLDWVKAKFWGLVVKDSIPIFHKVWDTLQEHGNIGKKNRYVYGDIDVGVWIEKVKDPEDRKIIVSECYCSCADDNTHLFILSGLEPYPEEYNIKKDVEFLCCTAYPQQIKHKRYNFGDDRDIKFPSLQTYKDRDFVYGYRDGREKTHVFNYTDGDYNGHWVEKAYWDEQKIAYALWELERHASILEEYEQNKC